MNDAQASSNIEWQPTPDIIERARVTQFIKQCGARDFADMHCRSIADVAWFTEQTLRFLDVKCDPPYTNILDVSRGKAWARWCVGGGLNISARCVDYHLGSKVADQPAVIWEGEEGGQDELSYSELHHEVVCFAAGLRHLGITRGDSIGIHLPMMPETIIALLAIARISAIAVPVFSGYGAAAIAARLQDTEAKALITCDGFPRRGKIVEAFSTAQRAAHECPTIQHLIVVRRTTRPLLYSKKDTSIWTHVIAEGERIIRIESRAKSKSSSKNSPALSRIEPTNAEDPLMILYTSGTTGKPKGIVHSHCGFPVKAAQDMAFGCDVKEGTRICWVTDIGWMMGAWLIYGACILGATIVLYDGAPDYPQPDRLWDFCARHKVEVLGISPSLIRALAACGDELPKAHDLSNLKMFASTGEAWDEASWWWLFEKVGGKRLPIINYSGGTEISGGILMGSPVLSQKPCSFPAACLGMSADTVDEAGNSVSETVGELVIREPWIGMARGFWKDPERYLETYWQRFPDVWVHGDWAERDADGHWYIRGRSDDTLKIAGKRVGPAEVESILIQHESVIEAAVIGVPDEKKGTRMIAFCVLKDKSAGDENLSALLREAVGTSLGKPLRPDSVHFVPALPKTRNAKTMRRVIRAAYLNEAPGDVSALENPESLAGVTNSNTNLTSA
ncbi:MAG: AMP-binding protein [Pyrinomonadaceae bacterium MAG19_C2-C3]|nr:AMP-binding protein [Pyrinomonadaceae bacterium MAG19_C2-C3]